MDNGKKRIFRTISMKLGKNSPNYLIDEWMMITLLLTLLIFFPKKLKVTGQNKEKKMFKESSSKLDHKIGKSWWFWSTRWIVETNPISNQKYELESNYRRNFNTNKHVTWNVEHKQMLKKNKQTNISKLLAWMNANMLLMKNRWTYNTHRFSHNWKNKFFFSQT